MPEFSISEDTMVVSSSYVTRRGLPILEVSRELDEEGGELWQFHAGNGDYSMDAMELVRLSTILAIDPSIVEVADLPIGKTTRRESAHSPWSVA